MEAKVKFNIKSTIQALLNCIIIISLCHFVSKSQKFVFYLLYFGGQSWSYKKDTTTQQLDYIYDEIS